MRKKITQIQYIYKMPTEKIMKKSAEKKNLTEKNPQKKNLNNDDGKTDMKKTKKIIKNKKKSDKKVPKLSTAELKKIRAAEKILKEGMVTIKDLISPSSFEINFRNIKIGETYAKSFFVYAYPQYIGANWLSPIINLDATIDVSMFIYPFDSGDIMKQLRKRVAEMNSTIHLERDRGLARDPGLEAALEDAESLRDKLARGQEKFFQFGLYFTIYADSEEKIKKTQVTIQSLLGGKLVLSKPAEFQHKQGFETTLPFAIDNLEVYRSINTEPLSSTFPFTSSDLSTGEGILYGINRHNNSLIIFERFSLENANSVIFAKSGSGKSFAVKLEILRSLMMGTDAIIIDPENEYEKLSNVIGGTNVKISLNSSQRINPFDLPAAMRNETLKPGDLLRSSVISLVGLLKLMLGGLTPTEEGLLDKALIDTYALKGITMEIENPANMEPPIMSDLQNVLRRMNGAQDLVDRLSKYTTGSYAGIFNHQTNIHFDVNLLVFQIRDLEDELKPIAMYIILDFIWNRIRSNLKKRILVIDEAWTMMQHETSAKFLHGLVKRARKYYLGVTTITQDVEDFLKSKYGKAIITNSSMQLLLKQAPSAADILEKVFHLSQGEKYLLMNSEVGQGILFAGMEHAAIQIVASYSEEKIITTDPEALLKEQEEKTEEAEMIM